MKRYVRELSADVVRAIGLRYDNGEISPEARRASLDEVKMVMARYNKGYITDFETCGALLAIERSMWEVCSSWDAWQMRGAEA